MAKLTAKKRNEARKYQAPEKSHASNAKARAPQPVKKSSISPAEKSRIVAKANRMLGGG